MSELAKSMLSCAWALGLLGAAQVAQVLSPLSAPLKEALQTGDSLQRGMVDLMFSLVTVDAMTSRHLTKLTVEVLQQSAEVGSWCMPGYDNRLAWQEFRNKLQAFNVFEHVDVALHLPAGADVCLTALVEQARAFGFYRAVWAVEGLGRYYAQRAWRRGTPQHLLTADQVSALPVSSLLPLHTGMGLSFAEHLLATLELPPADTTIDRVLQQFIALCKGNARPGYTGAVMEALGLVTRLSYPNLTLVVDRRLSAIAPDIVDYFWHGVGRGLYFLPFNSLPSADSTWRAVELAQGEAPHTLGQRNALAGLAWAVTLVNIRHPEILVAFLKRYGHILTSSDAFANGVSSALIIWFGMQGYDPYLRAFYHYQPDASDPGLVQLWNSQVRGLGYEALPLYDSVLQAQHSLDEVFRYQRLSEVVEQHKGEQVR